MLSKKENESFVYIWFNCNDKRIYVGKHKGEVDDGYICSSLNGEFWDDFEDDSKKWEREIVFEGTDIECLDFERSLLRAASNLPAKEFYNLKFTGSGPIGRGTISNTQLADAKSKTKMRNQKLALLRMNRQLGD